MRCLLVLFLLVAVSLQWAFNPNDIVPQEEAERRPARSADDGAPVAFLVNPFISPLARKWRKLRSRRDYMDAI